MCAKASWSLMRSPTSCIRQHGVLSDNHIQPALSLLELVGFSVNDGSLLKNERNLLQNGREALSADRDTPATCWPEPPSCFPCPSRRRAVGRRRWVVLQRRLSGFLRRLGSRAAGGGAAVRPFCTGAIEERGAAWGGECRGLSRRSGRDRPESALRRRAGSLAFESPIPALSHLAQQSPVWGVRSRMPAAASVCRRGWVSRLERGVYTEGAAPVPTKTGRDRGGQMD